jgi:hypothetical protein
MSSQSLMTPAMFIVNALVLPINRNTAYTVCGWGQMKGQAGQSSVGKSALKANTHLSPAVWQLTCAEPQADCTKELRLVVCATGDHSNGMSCTPKGNTSHNPTWHT